MNANSIIDKIDGKIADAESKLAPLIAGRDKLAADVAPLQAAIQTTGSTRQTAATALADAQAGHAIGEVDSIALRLAAQAVTAAEKAHAKALDKVPEVEAALAAERKLAERIAPLEASLTALHIELAAATKEAKFVAVENDLRASIETYTAGASGVMLALAKAIAGHQALVEAGRAPGLLNASIAATQCGSFTGYPLTGNVAEMMQTERKRIAALLHA